MKKILIVVLAAMLFCTGCSGSNSKGETGMSTSGDNAANTESSLQGSEAVSESKAQNSANENEGQTATESSAQSGGETESGNNSHILIAYFTVPEDDVDTVARASVVVNEGEKYGNTEYVAKIIQETVGGDLFRIEAVREYTHDHDALTDYAADEKARNERPELKNHLDDISKYDTVILGYPNWWADLPMPVYTFLEEYDFGAKTIIPFVTHGGSGFSGTRKTISELQPGAFVSDNSLNLSRNDILGNEEEIREWAKGLAADNNPSN